MQSVTHNQKLDKNIRFGTDNVINKNTSLEFVPKPPPVAGDFLLLGGGNFLLLDDNTNLLLLG